MAQAPPLISVLPPIELTVPKSIHFGVGCSSSLPNKLTEHRWERIFIVTSPRASKSAKALIDSLNADGRQVIVFSEVTSEPSIGSFENAMAAARVSKAEAVIGIGGGSPLDVAKLVAALIDSNQPVTDCFGIGKLLGRSTYLACIPTTSGTGSEVSPNAILLDEREHLKKGVVSPYLVPDAAFIDPALTLSVPSAVTAAVGMDALTHCIEAYANKLSHPIIDTYALEGIRLIATHLAAAVENGNDLEARTAMSLGSYYGGLCLGPVNTGAVHALAYPLGGEFHVPHGVANSLLLPHVIAFNLPAATKRYAEIAVAMGAPHGPSDFATAQAGLEMIRELSLRCAIPSQLSKLGIPEEAIEGMSMAAMKVTRLLVRNVREVTHQDALDIYRKAF